MVLLTRIFVFLSSSAVGSEVVLPLVLLEPLGLSDMGKQAIKTSESMMVVKERSYQSHVSSLTLEERPSAGLFLLPVYTRFMESFQRQYFSELQKRLEKDALFSEVVKKNQVLVDKGELLEAQHQAMMLQMDQRVAKRQQSE